MNKIYDFCWIFLVFCFILFCCNCVLVWQLTFHLILILISFYFIQWTTKIQNYKHQSWILSRFVCLFVCFSILFHLFCINSTVENKIKHLDFKRSEIKVLLDAKDDCFFLLLSVRVYVWVAESIKKVCAVAKKNTVHYRGILCQSAWNGFFYFLDRQNCLALSQHYEPYNFDMRSTPFFIKKNQVRFHTFDRYRLNKFNTAQFCFFFGQC